MGRQTKRVSIQSLIIDCDPGVDDAVALFLAFAAPDLNLLAHEGKELVLGTREIPPYSLAAWRG